MLIPTRVLGVIPRLPVGWVMRLDRDSFGRVLRAYRERANTSLEQLSAETKVSPELWMALEENDFSRWPTRIYARSLIRQYAKRVGLDPEELVNEFCRLFRQGDRRTETLLRECAAMVGHRLDWHQELPPTLSERDRRRSIPVELPGDIVEPLSGESMIRSCRAHEPDRSRLG